jgi:hypothetical protein
VNEALGDFYASRKQYGQAVEAYGRTSYKLLVAWAQAGWGKHDAARRTLADFLQFRSAELPVEDMSVAAVHAALGEKEEEFAWLDRAYVEHDPLLMFLKVDARLARLCGLTRDISICFVACICHSERRESAGLFESCNRVLVYRARRAELFGALRYTGGVADFLRCDSVPVRQSAGGAPLAGQA